VTCLIPKRRWTLTFLVLLGLCAIAGLEFLYGDVWESEPEPWRSALTALDVTSRGSLVSWFSSVLWLAAAFGSVMVYALRRHRLDDYRGGHRVWMVAALACVVASIDATTGLHTAIVPLMVRATGITLYGDGRVWWMLVFSVVFGLVGLRLAIEVRRCRLALASLLLACGGYLLAALVELNVLLADAGPLAAMARTNGLLLGHLSAALSVAFYGRFVHRDAQGEIRTKPSRRRAKQSGEPRVGGADVSKTVAGRTARPIRFDAAHDTATGGVRPADAAAKASAQIRAEPDALGVERLSKAERRRLKKQQRLEQE
jgi:hypothetical protein